MLNQRVQSEREHRERVFAIRVRLIGFIEYELITISTSTLVHCSFIENVTWPRSF